MAFQPDPSTIRWKLHLASEPRSVYEMLATDRGRAAFWAESAVERDGFVHFEFANGIAQRAEVVEAVAPERLVLRYFDSTVEFDLEDDGSGGTDLTMVNTGFPAGDREELLAGWLNVLLPLKAAVDHGIDLRNHDPSRTWDDGYVDQ